MNFDIVEVLTRAAKITWKYKILWIFGILASCGRGGGNGSNSGGRGNSSGVGNNPLSPEMMRQVESLFKSLGNWLNQNEWIIFAFIIFVLIAIILQIFFTLVGTAGLARGVVKAENGEDHLIFGELFSESLSYFWRLLGASLVIWIPIITILVIIVFAGMAPLIRGGDVADALAGVSLIFLLAICCCMVPFFIALGLYQVQVKRAILVEDMGVFGALVRGWQVFSQNIIGFVLVGVVLFILSFIISIILAIPALLIVLPLMGLLLQGNITSWQPFIAGGVFLLCYSPVAWFFSGILTTYTESIWTLAYLRIITPKPEASAPVMIEANA